MTEARPPPSSMASAYWSQGKNNSLWQTSSSAYSRCRLLSLPPTLVAADSWSTGLAVLLPYSPRSLGDHVLVNPCKTHSIAGAIE
jgi:hypothetical protein